MQTISEWVGKGCPELKDRPSILIRMVAEKKCPNGTISKWVVRGGHPTTTDFMPVLTRTAIRTQNTFETNIKPQLSSGEQWFECSERGKLRNMVLAVDHGEDYDGPACLWLPNAFLKEYERELPASFTYPSDLRICLGYLVSGGLDYGMLSTINACLGDKSDGWTATLKHMNRSLDELVTFSVATEVRVGGRICALVRD